ncbi:sugar transferase [Sphingobacteriales bacterium CHB3]|nr:sugar transferase [Sphingobacteriales bacterium CHB3]
MASAKKYPLYKYVLAAIDTSTIAAAYIIALVLEQRWLNDHNHLHFLNVLYMAEAAYIVAIAALCVFIFHYLGLYQIHVFVTLAGHLSQIVKGLAVLVGSIAVISFFTKAEFIADSRLLILYFACTALVLFIVVRIVAFRQIYLYLSRNKVLQRKVLIVGAGENGRNVAVNLFLHDYVGLQVVGFLDDHVDVGTPIFNAARVVGRTGDLAECVKRLEAEEILICLEQIEHGQLIDLMEKTLPLKVFVKVSSPLYDIVPLRRAIEHYGNIPVLGVFQFGMSERKELYKRGFDMFVSILTLILLSPMFAVVALLIKLNSKGSVFYRQVRVGKNGKLFNLYKFRSMTVGSGDDEERKKQMAAFIRTKRNGQPIQQSSAKIVNEARVTVVGKWLRKLSIDEFPQLINVLKGEMSIVGPRPCLPYELEQFEEWHKRRLSVLPGLTGMWQVVGRSVVSFDDMVVLDLHYIQNASFVLDLRVMLKTIPVMLFGMGAK